ncbi:MAG TPA: GNAT family N-acetyltransferase [Candidatus Sulfopaludibacter sp.]|nr:GNAT family N-acetyltransferase [Candidatus Sulfopaludibacter sp.]
MVSMLPVLETPRLVLSPLAERHLERFVTVAGARSIADTTISVPHPLTEADAREWIERAAAESGAGLGAHFAIALRSEAGSLIGYAAIRAIDREHNQAELSFWLADRLAGQGYATEAACAVAGHGFHRLELNRICAYHMVRNPASGRVLAKLGFRQEGCLRQRVRKWGVYEDVLLWAKLRNDGD